MLDLDMDGQHQEKISNLINAWYMRPTTVGKFCYSWTEKPRSDAKNLEQYKNCCGGGGFVPNKEIHLISKCGNMFRSIQGCCGKQKDNLAWYLTSTGRITGKRLVCCIRSTYPCDTLRPLGWADLNKFSVVSEIVSSLVGLQYLLTLYIAIS